MVFFCGGAGAESRASALAFVLCVVVPASFSADPVDPSPAEVGALSSAATIPPSVAAISPSTVTSASATRPEASWPTSSGDTESPLIDPFIKLPLHLHDATSTSQLMAQTQAIIDATTIHVPAGSRPVHLVDVVQETLAKNLTLMRERLSPLIENTNIEVAWAEFDPVGTAQISIGETRTPRAGFFSGNIGGGGAVTIAKVKENFFGLNSPTEGEPGLMVSRKLTTGTEASLGVGVNRQDSSVSFFQPFDQEYHVGGTFALIHPLMRGSGELVNLVQVRLNYNAKRISEIALRQLSLDVLKAAHEYYWNLVFARINLAITQQSLALAADLLRENRIRYKYGDLVIVEVLEAEAGVKLREKDVIQAENELENAMDRIRELVSLNRKLPDWQAPLVPVDPPVFQPVIVEPTLSLSVALQKSPRIQDAKVRLDNSREQQILAQDAYRPGLDLTGSVSESGLGENLNQSNSELSTFDYTSWNVGINFNMPLYRRAERAGILASNYSHRQAQLDLMNTEQEVTYEHRAAVRNIETLRRQVEASMASVRAEKDRLEKQKISHEQGITTSHDLLEVQEAFAQAQKTEIGAIVEYYISLIELERVRGTLLENLGFELVPHEGPR
ncbi:MAG: TolC family protein [Candidatus Omnitrophica bacterium]|nr:TolC family protein [Candidatus Omnitrophota bacterium]